MDIIDKLNKELLKQNFMEHSSASHELDKYREVAYRYACLENAISVLSDMRTNISYIHIWRILRSIGTERNGKSPPHTFHLGRRYLQADTSGRLVSEKPTGTQVLSLHKTPA